MTASLKRSLARALVFLVGLASLSAISGEAYAAPTGKVIANPSVVLRSGPSTSHAAQGTIPYGAQVEIHCTSRGSWVTGEYGATNLWNKVSYGGRTGFVTDAFLYTGTNSAVAPDCGTAP